MFVSMHYITWICLIDKELEIQMSVVFYDNCQFQGVLHFWFKHTFSIV